MKISIITTTYNSASTIEQTIQSVLNQSYTNVEYIIVDGGSTDGTMDIITRYKSQLSKIISEKDNGIYDALNKGIDLATGDIIGILHSDDFYINSTVIEQVANTFNQNQCDGLYANLYYVDKDDTNKIKRKWHSGNYSEGAFLNGWMPPHPTFFVKKEIYNKYGKFNLQFVTAADYELMLRFIHKNKIKLSYLNEFIVKMRIGGKSNDTVKSRVTANLDDRKAWEANGLKPRFYTLYLKPLRKIFQFL
ncbi:MAG TPA: glycosyltransferase family 2 protein [Bacteroidia bacterium]|nr:glycosyltransferase family 2 protein [Bacteroidia bacterium]